MTQGMKIKHEIIDVFRRTRHPTPARVSSKWTKPKESQQQNWIRKSQPRLPKKRSGLWVHGNITVKQRCTKYGRNVDQRANRPFLLKHTSV